MPHLMGLGGMVSFQSRLATGLKQRGIQVSYDLRASDCSAVLVVGGTRQLVDLWRARRRGIRIVQRLDGMNWLHRKQPTPLRRYIRAEANNMVLAFIRRFLATDIVYQSRFSKEWWEREHGNLRNPSGVIYNGVELDLSNR